MALTENPVGDIGTTVLGPQPPRRRSRRQSESRSWNPYSGGGIGIVARRQTQDPLSYDGAVKIRSRATKEPMRLMLDLPALHPSVGLAQWNALRLMWPKDGYGWKAHAKDGTIDEEGQAEVDRCLLSSRDGGALPLEVGSSASLACQLSSHLFLTGLICAEVEPAPLELDGARRIWPTESLSIAFARSAPDEDMLPWQKQRFPATLQKNGVRVPGMQGWVQIDPERFFWRAIDQGVDDPYGLAPYATALNEVLADLAMMRDLRDAVHNAAWPRTKVGINLAELHKVAVEVYRISDPKKAAAWVKERFDSVVEYVESLAPDDNIVSDTSGDVDTQAAGDFTGMEGVLSFLRQRLVQALKSLPTLLGVNDGSTFNYTSVEWAIYAAGLEACRDIVMELIAEALTYCMRLKGLACTVKPWADKIRTNDLLVEENTKEVRIRNALAMEAAGFIDHDGASMTVTKKKAVAPAMDGVLVKQAAEASTADGDGSRKAGSAGTQGSPSAGTTKEDRSASKK